MKIGEVEVSDVVVVAVVGIVGSTVAPLIAGLFNARTTRAQLASRLREIQQQGDVEGAERERSRRIETRRVYLAPMAVKIHEYHTANGLAFSSMGLLRNPEERTPVVVGIIERTMQASLDKYGELASLRGQLSDPTLARLLDELEQAQTRLATGTAILSRVLLGNAPRDPDNDPNAVYLAAQRDLRALLVRVNKRIEDLLAGDPAE